jgi:hypothetical protein
MREPDSHEEAPRPPIAARLLGTTVFVLGMVTLSGGLLAAGLISTSCAAALKRLSGDRHTG